MNSEEDIISPPQLRITEHQGRKPGQRSKSKDTHINKGRTQKMGNSTSETRKEYVHVPHRQKVMWKQFELRTEDRNQMNVFTKKLVKHRKEERIIVRRSDVYIYIYIYIYI